MTVIVQDHTRDEQQTFVTVEAAKFWLSESRGVMVFSPLSDGAIDCWASNVSQPVARILPAEVPQ
jgi:hypothetical protein